MQELLSPGNVRLWVKVFGMYSRNPNKVSTTFLQTSHSRMDCRECLPPGVLVVQGRRVGFGFTLPGSPWRETSQHPQSRPSPNWAMSKTHEGAARIGVLAPNTKDTATELENVRLSRRWN